MKFHALFRKWPFINKVNPSLNPTVHSCPLVDEGERLIPSTLLNLELLACRTLMEDGENQDKATNALYVQSVHLGIQPMKPGVPIIL